MNIILASQSPRRAYLLDRMGLDFTQIPSQFDEYFDEDRSVEEVARELGLGKARDVAKHYPNDIVIGSDLIVSLDGRQIGKPADDAEAKELLRSLSGRKHRLVCSVAVVCESKKYERVLIDTSEIEFDEFSDEFITSYIATGTVFDKAGGYAIQHPLVRPYVAAIHGRLDTIIGLPTNVVSEILRDFDIKATPVDLDLTDKKVAKALFE